MTRYRALVDLSYPTDADVIARILRGENVTMAERSLRHLPAGEIAEDVPAVSVPWLLEQGLIEPAGEDD